jgi:hypothetical protein
MVMPGMTVGELKEALDNFGDHLKVIVEIDVSTVEDENEEIYEVLDVDSTNFGGEVLVRITWG